MVTGLRPSRLRCGERLAAVRALDHQPLQSSAAMYLAPGALERIGIDRSAGGHAKTHQDRLGVFGEQLLELLAAMRRQHAEIGRRDHVHLVGQRLGLQPQRVAIRVDELELAEQLVVFFDAKHAMIVSIGQETPRDKLQADVQRSSARRGDWPESSPLAARMASKGFLPTAAVWT